MKIICLGDSFTRGFGVKKSENWISIFKHHEIQLINKGINGDTTSGMLARFYRDVVAQTPDYVLITGSINDFICGSSLATPQNNYMSMVHQAYHHQIFPIVGVAPGFLPEQVRNDWANFSDFSHVLKLHKRFHAWSKEFCTCFNLPHLDFYESFEKITKNHPIEGLYLDGLHLTPAAHRFIAKIAEKELTYILQK
ncbi:MAG: GDSL-type esterase/lipase family protein [Lachnospiraceae bacterium]|nr:GDSL-type esterase/lipase family protein [Lachnospiraceae bacterium]